MPQWRSEECLVEAKERREAEGKDPLPSLGQVHIKPLTQGVLRKFWIEGVHQTMVWVGHGRSSVAAQSRWQRSWPQ